MCVGFLLAAGAKRRGNGGASVPTVGDSRAAGIHAATPRAPRHPPSHEKSPGRTTGALSERYISFVDSSFSSTHSFSRMTGFLSTRPSRSAGTR